MLAAATIRDRKTEMEYASQIETMTRATAHATH
jgi:hypothetical protein